MEITEMLQRVQSGDRQALNDVMPSVYGELKKLAASHLRRELLDRDLHVRSRDPGAGQLNGRQARCRPLGDSEVDLVPIHSAWVSARVKNLGRVSVHRQFDMGIHDLRRVRRERFSGIDAGTRGAEA